MPQLTPFFREAGAGPGVVCLHANAASSSQWRGLMDRLAPHHHVLAADAYGTGGSPAWPTDRPVRLRDEAALLEPVFARAGEPFALVGHSYGAAVALVAALAAPQRVRALALYEPTLFSLLDAESPPPNEADGIRATVAAAAAALDAGDPAGAAEQLSLALALRNRVPDAYEEAQLQRTLGDLAERSGDSGAARQHRREAVRLYTKANATDDAERLAAHLSGARPALAAPTGEARVPRPGS